MSPEPTIPRTSHHPRRVLAAGATWFLVYLASRFALEEMRLAAPWAWVAAFAHLFAFSWFAFVVERALKSADELQRLIQLEALALAFSTTMLLLMTLGLMEIFHGGRLQFPLRDLWATLPAIYAICFAVAYQRYR
jgi:hypothetical protein